METETSITAKLVDNWRKKSFCLILNVHGGQMQAAGFPDLYLLHWRCRCWIECKGQKTKVTALQRKMMAEIIKRGDSAFILRFTNPKLYSLRTAPDEEVEIAEVYGTYAEAAQGILYEISNYQKLQDSSAK